MITDTIHSERTRAADRLARNAIQCRLALIADPCSSLVRSGIFGRPGPVSPARARSAYSARFERLVPQQVVGKLDIAFDSVAHGDLEGHVDDRDRRRILDQDLLVVIGQCLLLAGIDGRAELGDDVVEGRIAVAHPVGDGVGLEEQLTGVAGIIHVPQQVAHPRLVGELAHPFGEHGSRLDVDRHVDADLRVGVLENDGNLLRRRIAFVDVEREGEAVGIAGIGQHLLGLGQIGLDGPQRTSRGSDP